MDFIYQLLFTRLDLIQELNDLSEKIIEVDKMSEWIPLKKQAKSMKSNEKELQINENEHLVMLQTKIEFNKQERLKFQKVLLRYKQNLQNMHLAIEKLCPQVQETLHKIKHDGKHRNICLLFIHFFNHLSMSERVNEIKTIHDNKLFQTIPLFYLLIKYYIQVSRKIIGQQFKFLNHQLKQVQKYFNAYLEVKSKEKKEIKLSQSNSFRMLKKCSIIQVDCDQMVQSQIPIVQMNKTSNDNLKLNAYINTFKDVLDDITIEFIPQIHYTATIKYRILFLRNLRIRKSLLKYRLQRTKIEQQPQTLRSNNHSLNFVFQYYGSITEKDCPILKQDNSYSVDVKRQKKSSVSKLYKEQSDTNSSLLQEASLSSYFGKRIVLPEINANKNSQRYQTPVQVRNSNSSYRKQQNLIAKEEQSERINPFNSSTPDMLEAQQTNFSSEEDNQIKKFQNKVKQSIFANKFQPESTQSQQQLYVIYEKKKQKKINLEQLSQVLQAQKIETKQLSDLNKYKTQSDGTENTIGTIVNKKKQKRDKSKLK